METSSSSFKIKSLAKRTAHELWPLLLYYKKKREKERRLSWRMCVPHCYLKAVGAGLRLSLLDGVQ